MLLTVGLKVVSFSIGDEADPPPMPGPGEAILEADSADVVVDDDAISVVLESIDEVTVVLVVIDVSSTDISEGDTVGRTVGSAWDVVELCPGPAADTVVTSTSGQSCFIALFSKNMPIRVLG